MYHLSLQGSASTSDIYIGAGVFQQTAMRVAQKFKPTRIHVVTDSNVAPLYLREPCAEFPLNITTTVIPAGEEHKNLDTVASLYADLSEAELTRSDLVIALGGGVVGDITGFAAATYLRGIHVCQIPTTVLSQVDSSVGGKTGVDLPQGKNLVGAFYQPELVMIDTDILSSLPERIRSVSPVREKGVRISAAGHRFIWRHCPKRHAAEHNAAAAGGVRAAAAAHAHRPFGN